MKSLLFLVFLLENFIQPTTFNIHSFGSYNSINQVSLNDSIQESEIVLDYQNSEKFLYISSNYDEANMINYHISSGTTTYERFDTNSYPNKNSPNYSNNNFIDNRNTQNNFVNYKKTYAKENSFLTQNLRDVIGLDNRTEVINPKMWPYLATVMTKATYYSVYDYFESSYYTCFSYGTGFLVGPNLLLTAAHCCFSDVTSERNNGYLGFDDGIFNPRFPDKIEIFAGINGDEELILGDEYLYYAKVEVVNIRKEYFESLDDEHDWSALHLDRNLGDETGYYLTTANWDNFNEEVFSYGYPSDFNSKMCEAHGRISYRFNNKYYHNIDTVHGQSGSPIFCSDGNGSFYVCGIHTQGKQFIYNRGIVINNFILSYVNSFFQYFNYEHLAATIIPTDYGYPDSYSTTYIENTEFTTHTLSNGYQFETKRLRTGYIHNEYIVMSVIRNSVYDAWITYQFNTPVTMIEVQLSHWRELSHEWTYATDVDCRFRIGTYLVADLLSDLINLPTNRLYPTTYQFVFPQPTNTFTFQMTSLISHYNQDNRGRICIGNMYIYTKEGWF